MLRHLWQCFMLVVPLSPKVTGGNMSNSKPIFDFPFDKSCKGGPVLDGGCDRSFPSACENLAEVWFSKKVDLGGYDFTTRSLWLVDRSSPDFSSPNARGITVQNVPVRLWISSSIPGTFAAEVYSCPKSRQILHVLAPEFFFLGGRARNFGTHSPSSYKILQRSADGFWRSRGEKKVK